LLLLPVLLLLLRRCLLRPCAAHSTLLLRLLLSRLQGCCCGSFVCCVAVCVARDAPPTRARVARLLLWQRQHACLLQLLLVAEPGCRAAEAAGACSSSNARCRPAAADAAAGLGGRCGRCMLRASGRLRLPWCHASPRCAAAGEAGNTQLAAVLPHRARLPITAACGRGSSGAQTTGPRNAEVSIVHTRRTAPPGVHDQRTHHAQVRTMRCQRRRGASAATNGSRLCRSRPWRQSHAICCCPTPSERALRPSKMPPKTPSPSPPVQLAPGSCMKVCARVLRACAAHAHAAPAALHARTAAARCRTATLPACWHAPSSCGRQ
jgi:hypothetical protein